MKSPCKDHNVRPPAYTFAAIAGALVLVCSLTAQTWNQSTIIHNMDATVVSKLKASSIDNSGMVGANKHSVGSPGAFVPNNQRGMMDQLIAGLASYGRGVLANTVCDSCVEDGFKAIQRTYDLQTANGAFYTTVAENSDGTVTGSGGACVAADMNMFLAYSNNALYLLQQDSHYASLFSARLSALLPKIQKSMDWFYAPDGINPMYSTNVGSSNPLYGDYGAPNRALMDGTAYIAGRGLLSGYSDANRLSNWHNAGQWWMDNVFVQSAYFTQRAQFMPAAGYFTEGNGVAGSGYDTSYQGVAARWMMTYACFYPSDIDYVASNIIGAGRFLERRFLASDPLGLVSGAVIDDTGNCRTGPSEGGYYENKVTDFDPVSVRLALCYYDAMVNSFYGTNQTDGTNAATRLNGYTSAMLVGNPTRPPVIINEAADLTVTVPVNQAMAPRTFIINNAGIISQGTKAPRDPNATITASGLPAGLSLGAIYSPTMHNPWQLNDLDQNVGYVDLSGTPTTPGVYTVTLTPANSKVTYTWSAPPTSTAPTYVNNGPQNGTSVTLTITVHAPNTTSYEAENGTIVSPATKRADANASSGYCIGGMNNLGASDQINNVDGGSGGSCTLTITSAVGGSTASTKSLYVNGTKVGQISFSATGGWSTYTPNYTGAVSLSAGAINTIKIKNESGDNGTGVNLDKFTIVAP